MLDNVTIQNTMLDTLANRVSSISNVIVSISEQGYIPNKHKYVKLAYNLFLFRVIDNEVSLTESQRDKINRLYDKIINM